MHSNVFSRKYAAARRGAIALDFNHLNKVQREAVMTTEGPLLLLAGAGSGKTTVLINRIANLLKYGCGSDTDFVPAGVSDDDLHFLEEYLSAPSDASRVRLRQLCAVEPAEPWRIIAITFTNKAAGELKDRLEKMLGTGADDIWAMTFHSACARILRRHIDKLGYDRSFTIYDTSDTASLMKRILKDLDIEERNFPHRTVLGYISRAKDAMISAEEFYSSAESTADMRRRIIGRAYLDYSERLKSANALDFDDLILLAVRLFQEHPDVAQLYQNKFKYVLIDEYQDTNNLQYLLASELSGGHGNICAVGDDDQSIYKFRGATIENILSFERQFTNARVIRLEQNYRSTGLILDAASDVIRNNKGRKGKKLWTEKQPGEKPVMYVKADEREEAQLVADTIIASVADGRQWHEHAVLYRLNAQSNQLETAFKRSGVPFRIVGGMGFYDRAEIKDMLAYLCVLHNPDDNLRLLRIINQPPRGIGPTTVGRLTEIAARSGRPIFEIIRESQNHESLKSAAAKLHSFADMVDDLRELADIAPLDELYDTLLARCAYIEMLKEKKSDENISRIENVWELKTNIISFLNENGGSLFDFLSETALYTDLDRDDHGSDRVMMMTMHSAKGLEFDTVFIVGAEEGVFPGARAVGQPDEMEEERRLCYVAMTRAMRRLVFMSARRRMLFGKTTSAMPSRFVREISSDNIDVFEPFSPFGGFGYDFSEGFQRSGGPDAHINRPSNGKTAEIPWQKHSQSTASQRASFSTCDSSPDDKLPNFKKGDTVEHKKFGRGFITDLKPGGGDVLIEIAFENEGTRRMLLKSVARYLSQIENEE